MTFSDELYNQMCQMAKERAETMTNEIFEELEKCARKLDWFVKKSYKVYDPDELTTLNGIRRELNRIVAKMQKEVY